MSDKKPKESPKPEAPDVTPEPEPDLQPSPDADAAPAPSPQPQPDAVPQAAPQSQSAAPLNLDQPAANMSKEGEEAPEENQEEVPQVAPDSGVIPPALIPKTPEQEALEATDRQMAFGQDMTEGRIAPKSVMDLYANSGTLGKIGAIFGLLVSGAGAGLTHQPNALMELMNKEIERDLDAQKTTASNKQNWYRLSLAHEMQNKQIEKMEVEKYAQQAAGYEHTVAGDLARIRLKRLARPDDKMTASDNAANLMSLTALHDTQLQINKMQPGTQRAAAQSMLDDQLRPAVTAKIQERNLNTAKRKQLAGALQGDKAPDSPVQSVDYTKLQQKEEAARQDELLGAAPHITSGQYKEIRDDATKADVIRNNEAMFYHNFSKLNSYPLKGSGALSKELYEAETALLPPDLKKLMPSLQDFLSGAAKEKYQNGMKSFRIQEEGLQGLNIDPSLKRPPPKYPSPFKSKGEGGQEIKIDKNGVKWRRGPNGEKVRAD